MIFWLLVNKYVLNIGIILLLLDGELEDIILIIGKFVLNGVIINYEFDVDLY